MTFTSWMGTRILSVTQVLPHVAGQGCIRRQRPTWLTDMANKLVIFFWRDIWSFYILKTMNETSILRQIDVLLLEESLTLTNVSTLGQDFTLGWCNILHMWSRDCETPDCVSITLSSYRFNIYSRVRRCTRCPERTKGFHSGWSRIHLWQQILRIHFSKK